MAAQSRARHMTVFQQLVVNGCSYMEAYAGGNGHLDLAQRLGIKQSVSLAIGGSANSRILRTTLKHSYAALVPTLYVLGMTFLSRIEVPILRLGDNFEGRWSNFQNQDKSSQWETHWTQADSDHLKELKLKWEVHSVVDRAEDLMYRMLSTCTSLRSRGHAVVMFQQADNLYQSELNNPRLALFSSEAAIVDGYRWRAVAWQHSQGVPAMDYGVAPKYLVPEEMCHRQSGHHTLLNEFLSQYILKHIVQ